MGLQKDTTRLAGPPAAAQTAGDVGLALAPSVAPDASSRAATVHRSVPRVVKVARYTAGVSVPASRTQ